MQEMTLLNLFTNPLHNVDVESALLGSIFLDETVMDDVHYLEVSDFSLETHKLIWRGIKYQYQEQRPIDYLTIANLMVEYKRLDDIGGISYLTQLASSSPSAANAKEYARMLRDAAIKRKGMETGSKLIELANNSEMSATDYYAEAQRLVENITQTNTDGMIHVKDKRESFFNYLATKETFMKTGFAAFDDWAGGYVRGNLKITAGRPSVGKTAKSLQETGFIADQGVGSVLFWSQETKTEKLLMRIASARTGVNSNKMRNKNLDESDLKRLNDDYDHLEKLPIYFHDATNVTIDEIRATARKFKKLHGPIAMIVVDYLTLMDIPQVKGERWDQSVGRVTRNAKRIAEEMDCVFNMLAQLNREGDSQEPTLRHLKDSGDIEQDADIVEMLWEDKKETSNNGKVVQSHIAKGRDIGTNKLKYLFKGWLQRYEDYDG